MGFTTEQNGGELLELHVGGDSLWVIAVEQAAGEVYMVYLDGPDGMTQYSKEYARLGAALADAGSLLDKMTGEPT